MGSFSGWWPGKANECHELKSPGYLHTLEIFVTYSNLVLSLLSLLLGVGLRV